MCCSTGLNSEFSSVAEKPIIPREKSTQQDVQNCKLEHTYLASCRPLYIASTSDFLGSKKSSGRGGVLGGLTSSA